MATYTVVMVHDASTAVEIDAESFDEAVEKALETPESSPILCHQCAHNVELGDIVKTMVENQESGESYEE